MRYSAVLRILLSLLGALGMGGAAGVVYLAFHTPDLAVPPVPPLPDHPTAIEHWVNRGESRHPGIVDGTEARVVWGRRYTARRTERAIVYLHGFSASRQETAPLVERLSERWNANAYEARLSGHGRGGAALARAEAGDWLGDAREALAIGRALGENVVVVGSSTGATLAAWLASRGDQSGVLGYVLLSPNFAPRDRRSDLLLLPGARTWAPWIHGRHHGFEPANRRHARYWTTRYPTTALVSMMRLVDHVRDRDFDDVRRPVLTLYSPADTVVDTAAIREWHEALAAPRKHLLTLRPGDPAGHVLAGDILSPATTGDVVAAVETFFGAPPSAPRPSRGSAPEPGTHR